MAEHDDPTPPANPDPQPGDTPGLTRGGSVPSGETPPDAGQTSGAVEGAREHVPNQSPPAGTRGPMVVTLMILGVVVLMVLILVGSLAFGA